MRMVTNLPFFPPQTTKRLVSQTTKQVQDKKKE